MDILESLEVRWFLPSESPTIPELRAWFGSTRAENARIDYYLATGRHDLGFKARIVENNPAKVETKYLVGSLGVVDLAPGMRGDLQRWTKLSLELDDPELRSGGAWLAVTKTRQLRKFSVDLNSSGTATEVPVTDRPDAGCGVELTQLTYTSNATSFVDWTFGLEAFGPSTQLPQLLNILQAVCRAITSPSRMPELCASWTASYPTWLLSKVSIS